MTSVVIDILRLSNKLKARGFTEDQAAGITEAIQEINYDQFANKGDIESLKTAIIESKADILKWLVPILLGQVAIFFALLKFLH